MRRFRKLLYMLIICFVTAYGAYFAYTSFYQGTLFNVIAGLFICAVGLIGMTSTLRGKKQNDE